MKKLLIITYYWPPAGGPGVQRWTKFTKYLAKKGYSCHVLTVDEAHASYPAIDHSLQQDIHSSIRVTKTKSFEALKVFSSLFRKEKVPYAGIPDKNKMSGIGKLALWIRSNFFIPDARIGWNNYALRAAREIIREEKIDIVITTSPPHSTQLIGLTLKKEFPALKWLADLRDPWTDIYYYHKLSHSESSKQKDIAYEKNVLINADTVMVTSPLTKKLYAAKIETRFEKKFHVITNGFDEDDVPSKQKVSSDKFVITFAGTINEQFGIEGFVEAVKSLQRERLLVQFVGTIDEHTKKLLQSEIPSNHSIVSYVPHKELINYLAKSQALLLAIPRGNNQGTIPGKLFEYLATQKPIVCVAPAGSSAEAIIAECESGKTFVHDDASAIKEYLQSLIERWNRGEDVSVKSDAYKKYSRNILTDRLIELVEAL